jgi:hypothetical protein
MNAMFEEVIPAAFSTRESGWGIQRLFATLDPRLRGDDGTND